MLAILRFDRFL